MRTANINCTYKAFMRFISDKSFITSIGRQFSPGKPDFLRSAYELATRVKYRPLILDFSQSADDRIRVRNSFFPDNDCEIYLPR